MFQALVVWFVWVTVVMLVLGLSRYIKDRKHMSDMAIYGGSLSLALIIPVITIVFMVNLNY